METQISYTFSFKKILSFYSWIALFFGTIIIVGTLLFEKYIVLNSEISGAYKIYKIVEVNNENEIAILGSSRAQSNFVSSILGEDIFNYGIDGIQDNVVLFMLKEELKKEKHTPVIINFDLDGVNSISGDLNNYIPMIENVEVQELIQGDISIYQKIPVVKYFGEFEYYLKVYLNNKMNLTKKTDNGGSYEINTSTTSLYEQIERRSKRETVVSDDTLLINKYHSLIKSTERDLIFVVAPFHDAYLNEVVNIEETRDFLNNIKEYDNVRVIDMSEQKYPDSLYLNITHFNYQGAKQFSLSLKDSLIGLRSIRP